MCDPVSAVVAFGLQVAQSINSHQQQRARAKAQQASQQRQAENLRRQYALEQSSRLARLAQEKAAASLKLQKLDRQRLGERATAVVSSLESGADARPSRDVENRFATLAEETRQLHKNAADDVALQNARAQQALVSQLAGFSPVKRADTFGLVLGLGEAGLKLGKDLHDFQPDNPDGG